MAKARIRKPTPVTVASIGRYLRMVEIEAAEKGENVAPGTGATILRLKPDPVGKLVDQRKIGPEGLEAAREIEQAFDSIAGSLWIKPLSMERRDRSYSSREPEYIAHLQSLYRQWADAWSAARKQHQCIVLPCTIGLVIDHRSPWDLCQEYRCRHEKAEHGAILGIMDWARRAGKLTKASAQTWQDIAAKEGARTIP